MVRKSVLLAMTATLAAAAAAPSIAATYKIDPAHSVAQFSVRHLMISNVKGSFSSVGGTVDYDANNPKNSKVEATIDVKTISTAEPQRDEHLKSPEFFDVTKYPQMTFKSKKVLSASKGKMKVVGDLTLHGVTKEVTLDVDGPAAAIKDPKGMERTGATATTTLDRKAFGLTWQKALDTGGVMIGEEIPITIEIEMMRDPKVAEAK